MLTWLGAAGIDAIKTTQNIHFWAVTEVILIIATFSIVAWLAQLHWNRRHMYKLAKKIHGPPSLPFLGSAIDFAVKPEEIFITTMEMFNKYPPPFKFWIGHKLFYGIADPEDLQILLNSPKTLDKDEVYYDICGSLLGKGLYTANASLWKGHRKAFSNMFNQRILDGFMDILVRQGKAFTERLQKLPEFGSNDIFDQVQHSSLSSVFEAVMGQSLDDKTVESIRQWINNGMAITHTRIYKLWFHFQWFFNLFPISKRLKKIVGECRVFAGDIVEGRKLQSYRNTSFDEVSWEETENNRRSFLDNMIELSKTNATLNNNQLSDEVITLVTAGYDTSAIVACFVLEMLGMHPNVQDKVYEELGDVVGHERDLEAKDLPRLKYLERVVKETMRLFPPGPILNRKAQTDIVLKTCTLPAGSSVIIGLLHLHRNENIYPDPLKFDPDRFLPEEVKKRHRFSHIPFSAGPRNCIGIRFGMMSTKTLISSIVRKFRVHSDYKSVEDIELRADMLLRPIHGHKIKISRRE